VSVQYSVGLRLHALLMEMVYLAASECKINRAHNISMALPYPYRCSRRRQCWELDEGNCANILPASFMLHYQWRHSLFTQNWL